MTPPRPSRTRDADQTVILADEDDLDVLAQVIAAAFHDLASSRWLIADPATRRKIFPGYFRLLLEHALDSGLVYTTPHRTAAALWLPISDTEGPADGYDARLAAVTGPWADRFRAFDATLDRHHPAGIPHQHLAILAVRPDRQHRGTGTSLLHSGHEILDHTGSPVYLEASSARARDLYLAYGYALRPGVPFHLPDGGPPLWPMWREPAAGCRR
jgi:GNAT superfamily N-acetyltransferase